MHHEQALIKEIISLGTSRSDVVNQVELKAIPQEELQIFTQSLKNLHEILHFFDMRETNPQELERWALIYILLHDLFHQFYTSPEIHYLETQITTKIFKESENVLTKEQKQALQTSYLLLALNSLKTHHHSLYLISEKIILGEGYFYGIFEPSLWGQKINHQAFEEVIKSLTNKLEKDSLEKLFEKYKNFVPNLNFHLN